MRKESTESRSESRPEWEQLEDWVRSQVQRLIQELLEEEVTAFLGRAKSALRSDSDNDTGYRNGYVFCWNHKIVNVLAKLPKRQQDQAIARGLQQGARIAKEFDFQYIVTMNSDDLPPGSLFEGNFNISDYIMPLRLTDQTEEGGQFERPPPLQAGDPDAITSLSPCRLHPLNAAEFASLGNIHTTLPPSSLANVHNGMGVFIVGSFAGGFGFSPTSRSHDDMDVLCDFAVSGRRRLSKLVPMLIRTTEVREYLEKKEWIRTGGVATIVLTNAPYSMKYRGTGFEIRSRSPGQLASCG